MPRHHRNSAELAHSACVAQDDAVDESPANLGQGDPKEQPPAARPQDQRCFLLGIACCLQGRQNLASHKGESDKGGGQHDARRGEDDLDVVVRKPLPAETLAAEQKNEDQARDDRRHREGQIDERDEKVASGKAVFRNQPGRRHAEYRVERNNQKRSQKSESDGRHGFWLTDRPQVRAQSLFHGLREHGSQGQQHHQGQKRQRQRDQGDAH